MDDEKKYSGSTVSLAVALGENKERVDKIDDAKLVSLVKDIVGASQKAKEGYLIPKWLRALYFYLGYQHIDWSSKKRRYYPQQIAPDRRITVNRIRARVLVIISSLTRFKPGFSVLPRASGPRERAEARVAEKILRSIWDEGDLQSHRIVMAAHQALFGGVFARARFDPSQGIRKKVEIQLEDIESILGISGPPEGETLVDGRGRPQTYFEEPEGRIEIEMMSHFEACLPPSAQVPIASRLNWIASRKAVPVDEIRRKYGISISPEERCNDIVSSLSLDLGRFFSSGYAQGSDPIMLDDRAGDSAWLIEMHCAATNIPGFEVGRHIVIAGDKLLENEEGELEGGRIPYHYFPLQPVPLSAWGSSPVDDMIEPQMYLNRMKSHIGSAIQQFAFPYMIGAEGAVTIEAMTGGGRAILYKPNVVSGDPLKILPPPSIGVGLQAQEATAAADIDATASLAPFSMGQMQGASPQPVGTVDALLKADLSDLQPGIDISSQAWAGLGQDFLEEAQEHYKTPRIAYVLDETDDPEIFEYTSTDIPKHCRVVVKESSEAQNDKNAIRTQLAEIVKSGMMGPVVQDPTFISHLLEIFDMPAPESFLSLNSLDMSKQERELTRLVSGQPVELGPDDNDDVHLQVIARFTKTAQWDVLEPQLKQLVLAHRQEHTMRLQQQMMAQQQAAMAAQGGRPGAAPGQPPQEGLPQ